MTFCLGGTGYALYLGALWNFQLHGTRWFLILSGALLGVSAALFWAAQGSVMMAYPLEKDKGRSFTAFWVIFQMGTLMGSSIALGIEFHSKLPAISAGVYVAFMIIMLITLLASWLVLPPHLVVRGDGSIVELHASLSPKEELHQFIKVFKDWRMVVLFPAFFASNYFYSYQGALTAHLFNARTRALVAFLTGLGSMIGSLLIGALTDILPFKRKNRALISCLVVFVLCGVVWGPGLAFQLKFDRHKPTVLGKKVPWDWTEDVAAGPIILIFGCELLLGGGLDNTGPGDSANNNVHQTISSTVHSKDFLTIQCLP